jgi:lysyl-tRNA synthetase class 2
MSNEQEQFAQRLAKLDEIRRLGVAVYPTGFRRTATVASIVEKYGAVEAEVLETERPTASVAGRVLGVRSFGKARFLVLSDGLERLQAYVRADAVDDRTFEIVSHLDLGDHIGVSGRIFRTRTRELTIWVDEAVFLVKSLLPLPEKWHGLTDVETRYRQRYLDLIVNPDSRRVFETRARVISSIRRFLDARGFLEVETPMMQPLAGGALARPFVTHHNALDLELYLRVAPELYLKRLVVGGFERVYEVNRNFRNEGISTEHNPEFTMLEFYEAYVDYHHLMTLTEVMLGHVLQEVTGSLEARFGEHVLSFDAPYRRLSLRQAAADAATERLQEVGDATVGLVTESDLRDRDRAALVAARLGLEVAPAHGVGKIATTIFEALWEDRLVQPTFVYDFPTEVSPLSKQKADDPDTVERFELYAGGFEIANGFSELNDPAEQRRRFEAQLRDRAAGDVEAHRMDEDYIRALEYGLPPTGGEGIGIDRLVMIITNRPSIRDVILFPLMRPVRAQDADEG